MSQFHYGSIQIYSLKNKMSNLKKWSQFHYGSIQISTKKKLQSAKVQSQFHYGSIQINLRLPLSAIETYCLNSTMVRFKFPDEKYKIKYVNSLNSTMVRFKYNT